MTMLSRRQFNSRLLNALLSYSLLDSLFATNAIAAKLAPLTKHWANDLQELCMDLQLSSITPAIWQDRVEALFQKIELKELLQFVDFERLVKGMSFPDLGVTTKPVVFPRLEGLPARTVFTKKIFGMKKGRAIIPHGHSNMASAHLVLRGDFHMRHYEKVGEQDAHLLLRPTIDRIASTGSCSSISDERDNVHWFIANSETAFTFDVIMLDLKGKPYDIQNVDIEAGEKQPDGTIRAKILDVETALKKYGKRHH